MEAAELVERIWARDTTLWTGSDENRWLGWLDEPERMRERLPDVLAFAEEARAAFDTTVLLGMGGSSLAPEVLRQTFEVEGFHVLDTTHPTAVRRLADDLDPGRTLFLVASKSGTTLETRCHLDFFWELAGERGEVLCWGFLPDGRPPPSSLDTVGVGSAILERARPGRMSKPGRHRLPGPEP